MAGHKAAVFDSAPRFWQGAPRSRAGLLIKSLPQPSFCDQSAHVFAVVVLALVKGGQI
jgi:hypothetical protein